MKGRAIDFLKEILFPVFCIECGAEGVRWCASCLAKSVGEPMVFAPTVTSELRVPSFQTVAAFFNYQEKAPIGRCIREIKYNFARDIESVLHTIISLAPLAVIPPEATIIPIPLHTRRLRERGFNQAELVARAVAKQYHVVVNNHSLVRSRYTSQQAKLNRADREKNMRAAFVWNGSTTVPQSVVLVDDVYTTGATMLECAKALESAGVKEIMGLVLARG